MLLTVAVFGGMMVSAADAAPPAESGVVHRGDGSLGFLYVEDGTLAMTYDIETFCAMPVAPTGPGLLHVAPRNGGSLEMLRANVPVSVYDYPGGEPLDEVFGWLFANCGLIWDGDPATTPAQPIATGNVGLRTHDMIGTDGTLHIRNSLVGQVTTTDGTRTWLNTLAVVEVNLVTGIAEVKTVSVKYGG